MNGEEDPAAAYEQGDVLVAADPFGNAPRRPYLVISNESRPFQGEEYLVAGITTTDREEAIPLSGAYEQGTLNRESYVAPWAVLTIRHEHVTKRVAVVSEGVVEETVEAITGYVTPRR